MGASDPAVTSDMLLGEIRGQLREVVHNLNNLSSKVDGLSREVIRLGPVAAEIAELKAANLALSARLGALEAEKERRAGAAGVTAMILKSPALGWLVGAAITAWAILTGKVQI